MSNIKKNDTSGINPLFIIGALFFIFGGVTWLSSVLIPYLKIACELNNFQSYLVAFAFYISYFVMAIPSAWVLKFTGYKKGMSVGLLLVAIGSLVFVPAALYRQYSIFLFGLFVQGAGLSLLQTASNPYVTILGPIKSAAKRMSIMGICNGVAGIIAPIVLGAVILDNADALIRSLNKLTALQKTVELNTLAQKVIIPYMIIAMILIALSAFIYHSSLPEIEEEPEDPSALSTIDHKTSVFQFPYLLMGVFTLFVYTGVEVIAGSTIISYGIFQSIPLSTAKFFTSFTLICMLVGYLVGIICIPKYFSQEKALKYSALIGVIFAVLAIFTHGYTSVLFVALLGLSNSLMCPAIWPLALDGLGKFTKIGASFLVMAISGGAVLPLIYGWLADHFSAQQAYALVIPCYLIIGYYAISGHNVGKHRCVVTSFAKKKNNLSL